MSIVNKNINYPIEGEFLNIDWLEVEPPEHEFSINPLAPVGAVTFMVAHGGTGKSLLALKMAIHIALGLDIIGAHTAEGKVAFMSLEDSVNILRHRLFHIVKAMPENIQERLVELTEKLMIIDRYGKPTHMANNESGTVEISDLNNEIIKTIKENGIKSLFIDTFIRTNTLNENDNAQMGALLVAFEKIAREANCAVVLLHHIPKTKGNALYAARGASAITDNARSVILLETVGYKDMGKFKDNEIRQAIQESRLVRIIHLKHNYSAKHPEQYIEIIEGIPFERFTNAEADMRSDMKQRYLELYAYYKKINKPITRNTIDTKTESIRPENTNYSKWIYKNALIWGERNGYAKKTEAPEGASNNTKAEYYALDPLPDNDIP